MRFPSPSQICAYRPEKNIAAIAALFLTLLSLSAGVGNAEVMKMDNSPAGTVINLPAPGHKGKMSLEEALKRRESVRSFTSQPLTEKELSQLLWAAQGVTRQWGARTAPSAGALYPLETYVVVKEGVFQYSPQHHRLIRILKDDLRAGLAEAALGQTCIREAPSVFVITAVYERTAGKYGTRAERYVKMEAGHEAQNILLQAAALSLGSVPVGAFRDDQVKKILNLPASHEPLYLIPVGHRK